jgi:hypothetical protein
MLMSWSRAIVPSLAWRTEGYWNFNQTPPQQAMDKELGVFPIMPRIGWGIHNVPHG